MPKQETHDALWTLNGDLVKNQSGGLDTTKNYQHYQAVRQIMRNRIAATAGDWKLYPSMEANLQSNIGDSNDRAAGQKIESDIVRVLTYDGFISSGDLQVKAFPLSPQTIAVRIRVQGKGDFRIYETLVGRSHERGGVAIIWNSEE